MCGIVAILNVKEQSQALRDKALKMSQKIRHRGPDWSGIYCGGSAILAHERLSIVDPESGGQPLYSPDKQQVLAVNGEIYNHQEIRRRYVGKYDFQTGSDCEVILALYRSLSPTLSPEREESGCSHEKICGMLEQLSGIFAFVLYDEERDEFLIARDPIGVIPLYIGYDDDGTVYVASELKALEGQCQRYEPFLPGHYYWSADPAFLDSTLSASHGGRSLLKAFERQIDDCLPNLPENYDIKVLIWHQGESDRNAAASYYQNFKTMIAFMRQAIYEKTGDAADLSLPFIFGTVSHRSRQYNAGVEKAQLQVANEDENVHFIDLSDAGLRSDNLHFDGPWTEYLGKQMYNKLVSLGLVEGPVVEAAKPSTDGSTDIEVQAEREWDFTSHHRPGQEYRTLCRRHLPHRPEGEARAVCHD